MSLYTTAPGDIVQAADVDQLVNWLKSFAYNAYDYGATGNGTDQTSTLQDTCNAVGSTGGLVYVGPGAYTLSAPLRIKSKTTLWVSPGATITLAASSACNMLQNWAVQANRRILDGVTSSSTTFTSATASFVAGDVGAAIRIYYQDGTFLDTTIASRTNGTTVVLTNAATFTQTGLYACLGAGRDTDIKVLGGEWVRLSPNGPDGYDGHVFRFRHADRLEIGHIRGRTTDGKFFVSMGDCTIFHVHDIEPSATQSDTVHINGPCSLGSIERITNYAPGDDVVAFTCGDAPAYGDTLGNITDMTCEEVRVPIVPPLSPFTVRILAGTSTTGTDYILDRFTVRDVHSFANNYTVNICSDVGSARTLGGQWGHIVLDGITNANTSAVINAVNVAAAKVKNLEVRNATNSNLSAPAYLAVQDATTVTRLITNIDKPRVAFTTGAHVETYLNYAQAAESPYTQRAIAYYDGSTIAASITSASPLNPTGGITIEMWIMVTGPTQVSDWTPIAKTSQYWLEGDVGGALKLAFTIVSGGVNYGSGSTGTLKAGVFNHIAATYDGAGHLNVYVNGVFATGATNAATTIDTSTDALVIGNRGGFSRYIQGQIADVRIWSAALSAADISAHTIDPGNLVTNTTAVLNARWRSDEGTGTTLNDSSGNSNNASLSSSSWNTPDTPYMIQPLLATGASHTVDDVITALQKIGLVRQS